MPILTEQKKAYIGLVSMTIIIGLSFILVKIGLRHASAIDLLAHRFSAGAISIGVLALFGVLKFTAMTWDKAKRLLLLSLFFPLLFFAFQTFGMQYSSASLAGIISATVPIITLVVANVFLKERTTTLQKIGILLSLIGIAYIMYQTGNFDANTSVKGIVLLFLSVFSIVAYYALGKKVSVDFSSSEVTVWMTLVAFVAFNAWGVISHFRDDTLNEFFDPLVEPEFLWSVLYLGILSSVVTSFLTIYALSKISASQVAVFNNLSPIVTIIGGVLLLGETLYSYQIIGGVLVILGVVLAQIFKPSKDGKNKLKRERQ